MKRVVYSKTTQMNINGQVGDVVQYTTNTDAHIKNPVMAFAPQDRNNGSVYKALTSKEDLDQQVVLIEDNLKRMIKVSDFLGD